MIYPFGHDQAATSRLHSLRGPLALATASLLWALSACVPSIDLETPDGARDGPLIIMFTPATAPAQEVLIVPGLDSTAGLAGPGDPFTISLLAYRCYLEHMRLPPGAYPLLGPASDGRPLPGTDLLFEGEVRDGEFQGWRLLSKPSQPMLDARFDPGDTQRPYPDCQGMGTIQDVAGSG